MTIADARTAAAASVAIRSLKLKLRCLSLRSIDASGVLMTTVARLRALVTVADAGSVREAARRLTVTESAVSAALSALAREVKVPLVERDGRGLRLTASGQAYSVYARAILGLHDEGLAAARGDRDPERGRVRVAATATAGEYLLPAVLADFLAHHPGVDLRLEVGS